MGVFLRKSFDNPWSNTKEGLRGGKFAKVFGSSLSGGSAYLLWQPVSRSLIWTKQSSSLKELDHWSIKSIRVHSQQFRTCDKNKIIVFHDPGCEHFTLDLILRLQRFLSTAPPTFLLAITANQDCSPCFPWWPILKIGLKMTVLPFGSQWFPMSFAKQQACLKKP